MKKKKFKKELTALLCEYNKEIINFAPDYVLAEYLHNCLKAFNKCMNQRNDHMRDSYAHVMKNLKLTK